MDRSKEMQDVVDNISQEIFGRRESESQKNNQCVMCGKSVKLESNNVELGGFRDQISIKEYRISSLCQKCQDSVFEDGMDVEEFEGFSDITLEDY